MTNMMLYGETSVIYHTLAGDRFKSSKLDTSVAEPILAVSALPPVDGAGPSVNDITRVCIRLWSNLRVFSSSSWL